MFGLQPRATSRLYPQRPFAQREVAVADRQPRWDVPKPRSFSGGSKVPSAGAD